jgi:3-oxoacyl-[acyl-carrier-protein] synthase-3
MRVDGRVRIAAAHAVIPAGRQGVEVAISAGAVTPAQAAAAGVSALPVAEHGVTAESLAVEASQAALAAAGIPAGDVGLLASSWMVETDQDRKFAPRVARLLGATEAVAFGVRQMSNGGAMGMQVALSQLLQEPRMTAALVVTSDVLGPDSTRRWQLGETGAPPGDAATAVVLSTTMGSLSVRSIATRSCTDQEQAFPARNPVLHGGKAGDTGAFSGQFVFRLRRSVREAVQDACRDAGLEKRDPRLATVLLPRVDPALARTLTDGVLALDPRTELVHMTASTDHLFAGDLGANLAHVRDFCHPAPGDHVLLINIGGGFTVTAMVVRAEDR